MTPRLDVVLGDVWLRMLPRDRRALALLGHCNTLERRLAHCDFVPWSELDAVDRVAIIRAMSVIGELAGDCAQALIRARREVELNWREDLQA